MFEGSVTCNDIPCRNGGTCSGGVKYGIVCDCAFGFEGPRCKSTYIMYPNTYNHERTIHDAWQATFLTASVLCINQMAQV